MLASTNIRPERMCVICRRRFAQADLIRLNSENGELMLWHPGAKGRSIYLCSSDCFQQAKKKRFFERSKLQISPALDQFFEEDDE